MAGLSLAWHLKGNVSIGPDQGPAYRLDKDYDLIRVWARAKTLGGNMTYDINGDGVSILSSAAVLTDRASEEEANVNASSVTLDEGVVITLDIDDAGSRSDATIQLDLEEA